jgi:hypothetical protein
LIENILEKGNGNKQTSKEVAKMLMDCVIPSVPVEEALSATKFNNNINNNINNNNINNDNINNNDKNNNTNINEN